MEDSYWEQFGEPKYLKPSITESVDPNKKGVERKSWIDIVYEKDTYVVKKEDLER